MSCNKEKNTITFDEKVKGWTSFHTYSPDFMIGMNNRFLSFSNGELYEHNSDNVPRNTFYGVQSPSKVSIMVNDNPSDVKQLQAVSMEGNYSWEALIEAYISNVDEAIRSSIKEVEFVKKEGIWYAHARRNESTTHYDSKSTYGLGVVTNIFNNDVTINGNSSIKTNGDTLVKGDFTTVGSYTIKSSTKSELVLTLSSVAGLSVGDFVFGMKNARNEGGDLRGYTIRMDLEINKDDKVELFCVNSEVMKSFP